MSGICSAGETREAGFRRRRCYCVFFDTRILGGIWAHTFLGVEADAVLAKARAHVRHFCTQFDWPVNKSFTFAKYGETSSHPLAREWCRKGSFFYKCWVASDCADDWKHSDAGDYEQSEPFLDWALNSDPRSKTWGRISELNAYMPVRTH